MNNLNLHNRRSIRLKEYDYSQSGEYFVTICTHNRECLLGEIVDEEMKLSSIGEIVQRCWEEIPKHFPNVELDAFVVMPNHVHGIIINDESCRGEVTSPLRKPTLGNIVAYFKYQSTKLINEMNGTTGDRFWQRNYFEHVIRDDKDLQNIQDYITSNPLDWKKDKENPYVTYKG
jgi:putative transposase